nr:sporulation protein [Acidothermales bacterium]
MISAKALVAVVSSAALALAGAATGSAPATAQSLHVSAYDVPADGQLVLRGHGYGHGSGMSQYGAEGAGRAGKSYGQIL